VHQICVAALQYFAPLAILAACWILAYHEGPAGSFVADVWRSYVMEVCPFALERLLDCSVHFYDIVCITCAHS